MILAIGFFIVAIGAFAVGFYFSRSNFPATNTMVSKVPELGHRQDVSGLRAEKLKDRQKAAEQIRKDRAKLIKQLIELAAEKVEPLPSSDPRFVEYPWHDSKHLAILLLGELRTVEALPVLLENLEYKNPRRLEGSYLDTGGWYPAAEALSKIGMPAVEPTIKKLGGYAQKNKGSELCCWVLKKILGVKLARARLQIAIEETRDPTVKKNLTAALPYFKTEQEKAAEERARRKKASG